MNVKSFECLIQKRLFSDLRIIDKYLIHDQYSINH